jgi:hypothetical protein
MSFFSLGTLSFSNFVIPLSPFFLWNEVLSRDTIEESTCGFSVHKDSEPCLHTDWKEEKKRCGQWVKLSKQSKKDLTRSVCVYPAATSAVVGAQLIAQPDGSH